MIKSQILQKYILSIYYLNINEPKLYFNYNILYLIPVAENNQHN